MSRSYKKNNISKDTANSSGKKIGSRKFRRKTKTKLRTNTAEDEELILPEDKSEVINDYDVVDYVIHWDEVKPENKTRVIKGKKVKKVNK